MALYEELMADVEEQKRQLNLRAHGMYKSAIQSGQMSYDKGILSSLAQAGGINIPPPESMPLAPELTRSADRQSTARRRRRGRASTMLTSTLGEETLG